MPSLPIDMFATPAWFDQIPAQLPSAMPGRPDFTVEHRAITPHDTPVVHQQQFAGGELVAWTPGRAEPNPDLILARSIECDAGDLLGRLTAAEVMNSTAVIIANRHLTCPLGIANKHRPGLDRVATRKVDLSLEVASTPFGHAELAIRLNSNGTQHLIDRSQADTDITLRLQWPHLTEWLHTDTHLGDLINRGHLEIDGPFLKITYIDGHLSWPPRPQHQQHSHTFKQTMDTYQQLRQNPTYLEHMDQIDETTPL